MSDHQPLPSLITSRRFAPLFVAQFFAAFNDNFLRNTVVFLILATIASSDRDGLITLGAAIFMAPSLLLSVLGGELADRFDKATVARWLKFCEIPCAVVAVAGLVFASIPVMMVALFLFGIGAALFTSVKYSILPDHLHKSELPRANAWIEGATFFAILAGTILAGLSFHQGGADPWLFGPMIIGFAVIAWVATLFIPSTGAAVPDLRIDSTLIRSALSTVRDVVRHRNLLVTTLMISWFWLVGVILISIAPPLIEDVLGGDELAITAFMTCFAVSIAIGSAGAAWFSAGRIVLLPAVIGTLVCGVVLLDLGVFLNGVTPMPKTESLQVFFSRPETWRVAFDLSIAAMAGAFIVVPSFAALQAWSDPQRRARTVAANNLINAAFMSIGAGVVALLQIKAGITTSGILLGLSICCLVAAVLMFRFLPTSPFRDLLSILLRAVFRMEVTGTENLQQAGPAPILALNHVSFLDGMVALAICETQGLKPPVFAVDKSIAQRWWVRPFLKLVNALPLDPLHPMATRTLIRTVQNGEPLVIFPEGRITVTGSLMKVYDGAAMVADKTGAPIVPIKIDGLERSYFSRLHERHTRKALFPKLKVVIAPGVTVQLDENLSGAERRRKASAALYAIMSDLVFSSGRKRGTLPEEVIRAAQTYGEGRLALQDPMGGKLTYRKTLTGMRLLAKAFEKRFGDESTIGVMLPNANTTVLTVFGLQSAGKVPAMLNFAAGSAALDAACKSAQIRRLVTSRTFVEKAGLNGLIDHLAETGVQAVYLEDLNRDAGWTQRIAAFLMRRRPVRKTRFTDPAAILFTSGSEGTPKGVVLSHANILANVAQAAARVDFTQEDKVFNALPMFHSFGLSAGTMLPLVSGVPVYLYPSPLHYHAVPEAIYASNATIIFGTDTFLSGYARVAHPYDMRSIRYCFAGAEAVRPSTREAYMNVFGIRILEGYGVTETAPILALNTPLYNRPGTVGKLMPGVEYRLDPVNGIDDGGRLFVKGPNVMMGYLLTEAPGVLQTPPDGWHDTGDIVRVDADGFVTIVGRAKRFAKIGGEMISLASIEALADRIWGTAGHTAVVSVSDQRKGERLILVTDVESAELSEFRTYARSSGVPELGIPSKLICAPIPLLGTGKPDYPALQRLVEARITENRAA